MAWETRKIEEKLKEVLIEKIPSRAKADEIYAQYIGARKDLVDQILPQIMAIENNLTDHGPDHIANVLDNVFRLLGDHIDKLNWAEIYFLCMIVLFHDVGNIEGRKGHFNKAVIQNIYNYVRNFKSIYNTERRLVCLAASCHSGKASDGSADTMGELPENDEGLFGEGISLRKLAPVLRFADELAEGPQRTSDYMFNTGKYDTKSEIYHKYAQITDIYIDRGTGRIAITYDINVKAKKDGSFTKQERKELQALLEYTYIRIVKLNDERRYNKYYSPLLEPFRRTDVRFNFSVNGLPCDMGMNELTITDLTVPGNGSVSIEEINKEYDLKTLIDRIEVKSQIMNKK